ncbi:MAG: BMP family ABC transporter substrate-binding protein [Armatimonadota bacterium]|nr:BMP family ABC transporter substrate-binding protein [Armatimonadota bacterium]MDR7500132.1 BMP family ABC transporter substrate-binding protein [Armatimonadota bacterium]MDR7552280.1 BMP family ABC transporter substrate-binding protein [Armatimonadota bacterium]MDR7558373.1 BMP family ABC transporter substrate-binding protein [Armatimonadota bacterium]
MARPAAPRRVLVWLVLLGAAAGCAPLARQPVPPPHKVGLVFEVGGRGDLAFNDMAHAGLARAQKELGARLLTREVEPSPGGGNRAELLRRLAGEEFRLVFGIGEAAAPELRRAAAEFPATRFVLVDGVLPGLDPADNLTCLQFREQEGAFLAGAAAALKSRSGVIGFLAGARTPRTEASEIAYTAGARYVRPQTVVVADYLEEQSGSDARAAGRRLALTQFDRGAEVVYQTAGADRGVFEAAVLRRRLVIGSDADQALRAKDEARSRILTSVVKRVDVAVYETVKAFVNGTLSGGCRHYGLAGEGITYAENDFNTEMLAEIKPVLEELRARIVDGRIAVPTTRAALDAFLRARPRR